MKLYKRSLEEIFQICIVLFIVSMFIAFFMSNIFGLIDKQIMKIENKDLQAFIITAMLFIQLVITTILYLLVESGLDKIGDIRHIRRSSSSSSSSSELFYLGHSKAAKYCIEIVLILFLIKMNSSLEFEMKYVSKYLTIVK